MAKGLGNTLVMAPPRLAGDLAVWLIILAELLAFGILFLSYAFARTFDVALFNASQRTLDLNSGAINTALLITGSWCVVRAVQAVKQDASAAGARWLLAAMVFLTILLVKTRSGHYGQHKHHALETGAAFWHMVDLLWIVLFPLVYVMR